MALIDVESAVGAFAANRLLRPTRLLRRRRLSAGDPSNVRFSPQIALALLAEQLYRIHRGCFDAESWADEENFITQVIGPMDGRLEPLANDIERLLQHI